MFHETSSRDARVQRKLHSVHPEQKRKSINLRLRTLWVLRQLNAVSDEVYWNAFSALYKSDGAK
jgi:hypothetical protein